MTEKRRHVGQRSVFGVTYESNLVKRVTAVIKFVYNVNNFKGYTQLWAVLCEGPVYNWEKEGSYGKGLYQ